MNFYWPYTGARSKVRYPWYITPTVLILLAIALCLPERKP